MRNWKDNTEFDRVSYLKETGLRQAACFERALPEAEVARRPGFYRVEYGTGGTAHTPGQASLEYPA